MARVARCVRWLGTVVGLAAATLGVPGPAQAQPKPNPNIIMFSGGFTDPFFGAMKKGADDAAKALGATYQYVTITDRSDVMGNYVRLLEQSVARKPDVLVMSNFFPNAMDPIVQKAVHDGITVVFMNAGKGSRAKDGAILYVGEEPYQMGKVAGERMAKAGRKHGLCVNHAPGAAALEERCRGFTEALKAAGVNAQTLSITAEQSQNRQAVVQAIRGVLSATPTIDGVFTLGSAKSEEAVMAVEQLQKLGSIQVGTTDISQQNLQLVKDGKLTFVLDQQPYLQGFLALSAGMMYSKYRLVPADDITTGPFVITKDNIAEVLDINKTYAGVRGSL